MEGGSGRTRGGLHARSGRAVRVRVKRGTATRGTRRAGVAETRARDARVVRVPLGEAGGKRRAGTAEADSANAMFAGEAGERGDDATLEGFGRRARWAMGSWIPV